MDNTWKWFLILMSVVLTAATGFYIAVEKKVDGYYLGNQNGTPCIYAHWTWHPDERVACSTDVPMLAQQLKTLNEAVKK